MLEKDTKDFKGAGYTERLPKVLTWLRRRRDTNLNSNHHTITEHLLLLLSLVHRANYQVDNT
jgi:hypothetical protein